MGETMHSTHRHVLAACASLVLLAACGGDGNPVPLDAATDSNTSDGATASDSSVGVDAGTDSATATDAGSASPRGSLCTCDTDCAGDATNPGVCVFGVCMNRASATCASGGSTAECPGGSRCWGLSGADGSICWPDCDSVSCAGTCDADGSCVMNDMTSCDAACGSYCATTPPECSAAAPTGTCADAARTCADGVCVDACSAAAPAGYCPPGNTCTSGACVSASGCPAWECTGATCTDLVLVPAPSDPASADAISAGFYRAHQERYSYLRRDMAMLLAYAACETAAHFPGTHPLGTGDLSQADGMTPGTDVGSLRHPDGTHTGSDMDLGYYQTDGTNNPQIICGDGSDTNANGVTGTYNDGYYCTGTTNIVDIPRQAYFLAKMGVHPGTRVFGVDRTLAAALQAELQRLRDAGDISATEFSGGSSLGYDDPGVAPGDAAYRGWAFHHHHTHLSFN